MIGPLGVNVFFSVQAQVTAMLGWLKAFHVKYFVFIKDVISKFVQVEVSDQIQRVRIS